MENIGISIKRPDNIFCILYFSNLSQTMVLYQTLANGGHQHIPTCFYSGMNLIPPIRKQIHPDLSVLHPV